MAEYKRRTKKTVPKQTVKGEVDQRGARPGQRGVKPFETNEKDRGKVKKMAGFGATQEAIAAKLGISVDTMTKYYGDDWKLGKIDASLMVGECFMKSIQEGSVPAQIFYKKTQDGWSEIQKHELTGKDGSAIETRQLPATDEWIKSFTGGGKKETP